VFYAAILLLCFVAKGQVVPDFSPSSLASCSPATITFTNLSTGPIKSVSWDFDNGSSSLFDSPSAIFDKPGNYDIELTAYDANGVGTSITKQIVIYENPKARFTADVTSICEREIVNFTNTSIPGETGIATHLWDFGDGSVSPLQSTDHLYTTASSYTVKLLVTDSFGCTADTIVSNLVTVKPKPLVQFNFPETRVCAAPISVVFNNQTTNTSTSFLWDFGDGNTSTIYNPVHSYTSNGMYSVKLLATHAQGCKDSFTISSKVEIAPLTVDFSLPATVCDGTLFELQEQISPRLTSPTIYSWSFSDASTAAGKTVEKSLAQGTQDVTLTINNLDCRGSVTKQIDVKPVPENTIETPSSICGKEQFVQSTFDSSGIDSFYWRIDNSYNRDDVTTNNFFDDEGEHYFQLFQRNREGCQITFVDTVYQSFGRFETQGDTGGCVPYSFKPYAEAIGLYSIDSIVWRLYDFAKADTSSLTAPTLSVVDTGYFSLVAEVKDQSGCIFSEVFSIGGGNKPVASYIQTGDTICRNETLNFVNTSVGPNKANEFFWRVGSSTGETKEWTPTITGLPRSYKLTHIAGHYGCKDTIEDLAAVHVKGPYSVFNFNTDSCKGPQQEVAGLLIEADSFEYYINGTFVQRDTVFTEQFQNGDEVKIKSYNFANQCVDSSVQNVEVLEDIDLSWDFNAGVCAPASIDVEYFKKNIDSIYWFIDGINTGHNNKILHTNANQGKTINIRLEGVKDRECKLVLDTTITIIGPKVDARIGQSFGCFPKTFFLIDSFWNDTVNDRIWVVDDDSIPSAEVNTEYLLKGITDPTSEVITIKLVAFKDSCLSFQQFNLAHGGVTFSTQYRDSIKGCDTSLFSFSISPDASKISEIDRYMFSYKGAVSYSDNPTFRQDIALDGRVDTVYISTINKSGCALTQELIIEKPQPAVVAAFSSSNAIAACAPLQVNFKSESGSQLGDIVSYRWYIDGDYFSNVERPSRVFTEPTQSSVSLVVTDERGCIDSTTKDAYVQIDGEKVRVDFGQDIVCDNDSFKSIILEGNAVKYEWDMGDGAVLEGDSIVYKYAAPGSYAVTVLVSDSTNCKYPVNRAKPLEIVAAPVAQLGTSSQCENSTLLLGDESLSQIGIEETFWNVNGDLFTNVANVSYATGTDNIEVSLLVIDSAGCSDSVLTGLKLYAVKADFYVDKNYYCESDSIKLISTSMSDTALSKVSYRVDGLQVATAENSTLSGLPAGNYAVSLAIQNEAGCVDSISHLDTIKVAGDANRSNTKIAFLSVGENNEVELSLEKDTTGLLEKYEIYNSTGTKVWETSDLSVTNATLTGLNPEQVSVCLKALGANRCGTPPLGLLPEHCTINTSGEAVSMARKINWTPYVGWSTVDEYLVYREGETGYELIGKASADESSYIDTVHVNCDKVQKYKVVASGPFLSYSDTCHVKPIWDYSIVAPKFRNVSVLDDESIEIKISDYQGKLPLQTVSLIKQNTLGNVSNLDIGNAVYWVDEAVDVNSGRYIYTAQYIDKCGSESPVSSPANSIFLSVSSDVNTNYPKLVWSQAKIWEDGVKYYIVFKQDTDGVFNEVGRTYSGSDTTFLDNSSDIECSTSSCYLVQAYDNNNSEVSRSNSSCSGLESRIYAPNAMTPNGDGLNDTYSPKGLYIADYELSIYNRWGERIFKTTDCMGAWDGTIDGEKVQAGVYFYVLQAIGADKVSHRLNGSITVLE